MTVSDQIVFTGYGGIGLRILAFRAIELRIDFEIEPGIALPSLNLASQGVIQTAIFGSDDFDVYSVDVSTLSFGSAGAAPAHKKGGHPDNIDGDVFGDLVSHYWMQETGIAPGSTEVCVSGRTHDGTAFKGCDSIQTNPPAQSP